jgi:GT2 family glycosyltransferase
MPRLSIVIATLGRPILIRTLESLLAAKGIDQAEILVIGIIPDGAVSNALASLMSANARIRHIPIVFESGDMSRKRNEGIEKSLAPIIAFTDDDVVVAPDWPSKVLEPFEDEKVGLVSGPSLVPDDAPLMTRLVGITLASKAAGYVANRYLRKGTEFVDMNWSSVIGCNMSYRRSCLESIGRFDPRFGPGDDLLASFKVYRLGLRAMLHPGAFLYHYPRSTLRGFWRQITGYGAVRIRLLRQGVPLEHSTLVPAVWVLSLVILGIGAFVSRLLFGLLLLDLCLYLAAALWITFAKVAETKRPADMMMLLMIPIMHMAYGVAEWMEFFRPDKDLSEKSAAVR